MQEKVIIESLTSDKGEIGSVWSYDKGGVSITVDDALSASSENPVQNKVIQAALNQKEFATVKNIMAGTVVSIAPVNNRCYECGELTSLTVSNPPANIKFWIWFTSGSTATVVTGIDNFTPEANKLYKITVENGYATFDAWTVGGGS